MSRLVSVRVMIEQLKGLLDTKDLSTWEHGFVTSVAEKAERAGNGPINLTAGQHKSLEDLHRKHFA